MDAETRIIVCKTALQICTFLGGLSGITSAVLFCRLRMKRNAGLKPYRRMRRQQDALSESRSISYENPTELLAEGAVNDV